jgi:hypothetical protein
MVAALIPACRAEPVRRHVVGQKRTWDNPFYPNVESWLLKVDCHPEGGMTLDPEFYADFGSARAHEMRLPNGDVTTESLS